MVSSCCAIGCTNKVGSYSCGRKITFHRFPAEEMRRSAWVKAVNRIDPNKHNIWNPSTTAVLCSEHFMMDDFLFYHGATVLKKDAVPSKFSFPQCEAMKALGHSSKTSTAAMASVPFASSSTEFPVQPSFICKEHSYAILASPRTLKRKSEPLEERLVTMKQALYNAEHRESRAKSKVLHILEELAAKRSYVLLPSILLVTIYMK